jgi:hypothetical protein
VSKKYCLSLLFLAGLALSPFASALVGEDPLTELYFLYNLSRDYHYSFQERYFHSSDHYLPFLLGLAQTGEFNDAPSFCRTYEVPNTRELIKHFMVDTTKIDPLRFMIDAHHVAKQNGKDSLVATRVAFWLGHLPYLSEIDLVGKKTHALPESARLAILLAPKRQSDEYCEIAMDWREAAAHIKATQLPAVSKFFLAIVRKLADKHGMDTEFAAFVNRMELSDINSSINPEDNPYQVLEQDLRSQAASLGILHLLDQPLRIDYTGEQKIVRSAILHTQLDQLFQKFTRYGHNGLDVSYDRGFRIIDEYFVSLLEPAFSVEGARYFSQITNPDHQPLARALFGLGGLHKIEESLAKVNGILHQELKLSQSTLVQELMNDKLTKLPQDYDEDWEDMSDLEKQLYLRKLRDYSDILKQSHKFNLFIQLFDLSEWAPKDTENYWDVFRRETIKEATRLGVPMPAFLSS